MPEQFDRAFQYFFSPEGNDERGDGSSTRPVQSLARAGALILENHGTASPRVKALGDGDEVEIVCIEGPGSGKPVVAPQPRYHYFITPEQVARDGDGLGTEVLPWPDLESAISKVVELHATGQVSRQLGPRERIQILRSPIFVAGTVERRKAVIDNIARIILMIITASLVLPLLAILGDLFVKAWPMLTLDFLLQNPQNYMTSGGIWAPLVGTFYLVVISLAVAAPIGVLAGVYLNEYAGDNWLTRIVNLAVVNLAGVPSIVHALFGVGAFVLFAGLGRSVLAASFTLAIMTLPVIITSTREALSAVPQSFREACWNMG
ncbi:MAG: PstA family ABC transporter permease, partial [Solimonas sp.]